MKKTKTYKNLKIYMTKSKVKYIYKEKNFIDYLEEKKITFYKQDGYYDDVPNTHPQATVWDMPYYKELNDIVITFLGNIKSKIILDLGSGIGIDTQFLLEAGANVVSLDSSEKSLKTSLKHNNNIHIRADASKIPFKKEVFDIVFGRNILHHLNEKKCLKEVRRVLKRNGTSVFIEPLKYNPAIAIYRLINRKERVPQHPFSPDQLKKISYKLFRKQEEKFLYTLFPFFYFFMIYTPKLDNLFSQLYCNNIAKLDKKITNFLPYFSWIQVIKFYK